MSIYNGTYLLENGYIEYLNEANFKFLPHFKDNPELKKYYNDLKDAEDFLNSNDEIVEADLQKFGEVAFRILDLLQNVGSLGLLPGCFLIIPIPTYIFSRLWSWAFRAGREAVIKSYGKKIIIKYQNLKKKNSDNDEIVKKCDEQISKIKAKLDKNFD